jgi:DNA-binding transcriptional LysR family regulator
MLIPYNWNLQELGAFCAICESRSLTRAALALHVPQPALSLMVRRWRQALGDPLFIRSRYGVTPTEHALALRQRIAPSLSELSRSLKETGGFRPEVATRVFRLHMSDIGQLVFLPQLTTFFHTAAPNAHLHIKHLPWEEVQDALSDGSIDIALGALPMIKGRVHSRVLRREHFVTVMRKKHFLARRKLDLAAFSEASHLVIDAPSSGHTLVESVLRAKGVHRRVGMTVSHYLAVEQILANSDYLLTVPKVAVLAFQDPAVHHIVPAPISLPTFDIRLHWHERTRSDPGVLWLRSNMVALYAR